MVAELNFSSLENIHGWMVVLHGQAYSTSHFTGKVLRYQSIRETVKLFHLKRFAIYGMYKFLRDVIFEVFTVNFHLQNFHP